MRRALIVLVLAFAVPMTPALAAKGAKAAEAKALAAHPDAQLDRLLEIWRVRDSVEGGILAGRAQLPAGLTPAQRKCTDEAYDVDATFGQVKAFLRPLQADPKTMGDINFFFSENPSGKNFAKQIAQATDARKAGKNPQDAGIAPLSDVDRMAMHAFSVTKTGMAMRKLYDQLPMAYEQVGLAQTARVNKCLPPKPAPASSKPADAKPAPTQRGAAKTP